MSDKENNKKKKSSKSEWTLVDLIIPVFAFALAVYYYYTLRELPTIAKYYGGTISVLIMICFVAVVFIFFKNKLYLGLKELKNIFKKEENGKPNTFLVAAELLCITLLYVGAIKLVGYTLATFVYLCVVMVFLGRRGALRILIPALIVTLIGYVLFIIILNLNITLDPVSKSLKYLVRGWLF